ncbi:4-hydroxy-tetrahydrodipicolinate reductase [Planctomycetales bacterium 10988]|nr:4-hydroxy-tetrahydrodipicolinate reductase [Planctomycetales bacterium 10988]
MPPIQLAVHGAAGRMGQRVIALAHANPEFEIVAALESAEHPQLGQDAGTISGVGEIGIPLTSEIDGVVEVLIDFSVPEASLKIAQTCKASEIPLVVATTGFNEDQKKEMQAIAHHIPLLWAPSMSLAVNLVMKLSAIAAEAVKDHASGVDVEIIERHHRFKEDAPSGTALRFGEIISSIMKQSDHQHGRHGRDAKRMPTELGYHAVRTGDNPGEHTIIFGFLGETIELSVKATNRDCYAHGALAAAKYLYAQEAGIYSMQEVLGLE